jgi:hypothetical protein
MTETSHKSGESFENKSQSDDVRRNNITAAKGSCATPALCGPGGDQCWGQRGGSHAIPRSKTGVH